MHVNKVISVQLNLDPTVIYPILLKIVNVVWRAGFFSPKWGHKRKDCKDTACLCCIISSATSSSSDQRACHIRFGKGGNGNFLDLSYHFLETCAPHARRYCSLYCRLKRRNASHQHRSATLQNKS